MLGNCSIPRLHVFLKVRDGPSQSRDISVFVIKLLLELIDFSKELTFSELACLTHLLLFLLEQRLELVNNLSELCSLLFFLFFLSATELYQFHFVFIR
jgi:hypothetical protein